MVPFLLKLIQINSKKYQHTIPLYESYFQNILLYLSVLAKLDGGSSWMVWIRVMHSPQPIDSWKYSIIKHFHLSKFSALNSVGIFECYTLPITTQIKQSFPHFISFTLGVFPNFIQHILENVAFNNSLDLHWVIEN